MISNVTWTKRISALLIDAFFLNASLILIYFLCKKPIIIRDYMSYLGALAVIYFGLTFALLKGQSFGFYFLKVRAVNIDGTPMATWKNVMYGIWISQLVTVDKFSIILFVIIFLDLLIGMGKNNNQIIVEKIAKIILINKK